MTAPLKAIFTGALFAALLFYGYGIDPALAEEPTPVARGFACYVFDMETITEASVVPTRTALFAQGWFSIPHDGAEALYSAQCASSPEFVDSLPDHARWAFAERYELPPAPEGFAYAEDISLAPTTFWGGR
jgi:hypothetical protein